jgi:DNA-binding transcriptional MocR family regulator
MTDLEQYSIRAGSAAELVRNIEAAFAGGELSPGERLPSVRKLALEVGLSPVTVAAALAELRRRGVIVTEPRRGSRIGQAPPIAPIRAPMLVPPGARDLSRGIPTLHCCRTSHELWPGRGSRRGCTESRPPLQG